MNAIQHVCAVVLILVAVTESMPQSAFTKAQHSARDTETDGPDVDLAGPLASPGPPGTIDEGEFLGTTTPFTFQRTTTSSMQSTRTTTVTDESELTTESESESWTDSLKCEACKLIAGWLVGKADSATGLEEWLDGKCDKTWLLAGPCKNLVATKIQKITNYHGSNAQLCEQTMDVC